LPVALFNTWKAEILLFSILKQRLKMETVATYIREFPGELLLVFGVVYIITYMFCRQRDARYSGQKLPPALPSLPLVGSLPFMPTDMKELAEFCISPRNKREKIFSLLFGSK